jgi:hypothetical protein
MPDESFMGFILRLTELNEYDSPTWITREAGIGDIDKSCTAVSHKPTDISALARITDIDLAELESLRYPVDKQSGPISSRLFYGFSIPQYVIRPDRPKICPTCLIDSAHSRRIWELKRLSLE